ncbi:MAG: hypothetical protein QOF48_1153 [Verrucomicrobiota bacterium]|jgi:PKD repeat protein
MGLALFATLPGSAATTPLKITSVTQQSGNVIVRWQGGTGRYQLLCRTNTADDWRKIGPSTAATSATNGAPPGPNCFFLITTDIVSPPSPTGFRITTNSCESATLNWSGTGDNPGGSGVRAYRIYRNGALIKQVPAFTISHLQEGLTKSTAYTFGLSAIDFSDNESAQAVVAVTTPACPALPPLANAGPPQTNVVGAVTLFDGSSSRSQAGRTNAFAWNFGDGTSRSGTNSIVSHPYASVGTYTVTLTVTDPSGATSTATTSATVTPPPPSRNGLFLAVTNLGGPSGDSGNSVAVDRFGNGFVGGATSERPFLAKVSSSNLVLWRLSFGGPGSGAVRAVAAASDGSVFVTGNFYASLDFGGGLLTSAGGHDIFVAKYSATGTHLWSKRFGSARPSTFLTEAAYAIAVGPDDSVVISGIYDGPVDFGGGILPTTTSQDVFVVKFSTTGSHLWSRRIGGQTGLPSSRSVAIDANGSVFVTGSFVFTVDFGAGPVTAEGSPDMFVAKYSSSGGYLWSRQFGIPGTSGRSSIAGTSIAVDHNGDAVVVGEFRAPVSIGGGTLTNATPGYEDVFVAKYAGNDGAHRWSKRFGAAYPEYAGAVALDANDNIIITGRTSSSVDFGGGPLPLVPGMNGYVASLTADGSHRWSRSFGIYIGDVKSLAVTTTGNLFVTGSFTTLTGYGGASLASLSGGIFVLQFAQ